VNDIGLNHSLQLQSIKNGRRTNNLPGIAVQFIHFESMPEIQHFILRLRTESAESIPFQTPAYIAIRRLYSSPAFMLSSAHPPVLSMFRSVDGDV
jgi:hypothetical protein